MLGVPGGGLEAAITCLNRADLLEQAGGAETEARITALCEEAVRLLKETDAPKDGYYAFVLEKCAPALDHHGFFLDAEELRAESARIYAANNK